MVALDIALWILTLMTLVVLASPLDIVLVEVLLLSLATAKYFVGMNAWRKNFLQYTEKGEVKG
jgi:hypothetical protein